MTSLSYQLYSSRNFPPLNETLSLLASLGYSQVEGYGGVYEDLNALNDGLKNSGLTMPTGHISLDMLENDAQKAFEIADSAGIKAFFCPFLDADKRPDNRDGWRQFAQRLEKANETVRERGLKFGWHNHDFEFVAGADGSIPMQEILDGAPSIAWEADIAWIVRGGANPVDWINKYNGRLAAVHIKDIAEAGTCEDEDGWADVGHGTMDWKSLLDILQSTPTRYFVMEHDNPSDHERFASRSISSVQAMMGA